MMRTVPALEGLDLARLASAFRRERDTTRARFRDERKNLPFAERAARGLALDQLEVADADAVAGGRVRLWLSSRRAVDWDEVRIGNGDPVCLWWDDPDESGAVRAVVSRRTRDKLAVVVEGDVADRLWDGGFRLDREAPEATFERGDKALARLANAAPGSSEARLAARLFEGKLAPPRPAELSFLDAALNPPQRSAVALAVGAEDLALIHGPPGTGKTRTLVEIVRQCVARGERVLVTAASNTAVDNLAERLIALGTGVVRLGHPARVAPEVEARTLDALVEASEASSLARVWMAEAEQLRRTADKRVARGTMTYRERRDVRDEAGRLMRDARRQLVSAQDAILARTRVVCATCTGVDTRLLSSCQFDRVIVDEATQALDPLSLIALLRAPRAVLAGDPQQLPPTVVDLDAARDGLASTWFERLARARPASVAVLAVQHRMNETLMRFPSDSKYEGKLVAAPEVAHHTLGELGVADDPLRPGALVFIDTAGRGWEEERTGEDPSTKNPAQAERVAAELRRLLRRGLSPSQVAVITPYEAQARTLRGLLAAERLAGLEIGTVDGFQGREKEAIVVDLVRSNEDRQIGFLSDTRRMNVALTRARRFLLVVGDGATLAGHPYYDAFMRVVEQLGTWVSAWADDPDEPQG
jgi:ATP-dependent RNA/DNA helicase IGHMBP2